MSQERQQARGTRKPRGRDRRSDPAPRRSSYARIRSAGDSERPASGGGYIVFALFLAAAAVAAGYGSLALHRRSNLNAAAPYHPPRHVVVFVLDGYTASSMRARGLRNIAALTRLGVTYPNAWAGQFPTSSATLAASLGTGVWPRRHGLQGDVWVDAKSHTLQRPAAQGAVMTGSIDQVLEPARPPSFASALKSRDPAARILSVGGAGCAMASAEATWAADFVVCPRRRNGRWRPAFVAGHALRRGILAGIEPVPVTRTGGLAPGLEGWRLGAEDRWVATVASRGIARLRPTLTYVTFPEPEILGKYAPIVRRDLLMRRLLRGVDRDIGMVVAAARKSRTFGNTVFALVSLHGFDSIASRVATARLTQAIVGTGTQPTYTWADGAALLGLSDPTQAQAAAQVVESERLKGLDEALYKTHVRGRWTYAPQYINPDMPLPVARAESYLLGTQVSARSAEVVALLSPHVAAQGGRLNGVRRASSSVGTQWDSQAGFLLISGHGTYRGTVSRFPARVVDVAPTLETMLGMDPGQVDGTVLADATFRPPEGAESVQAEDRGALMAYALALRDWENRASY